MTVANMTVLGVSWNESMMVKSTSPILVGTVLESGVKKGEWKD